MYDHPTESSEPVLALDASATASAAVVADGEVLAPAVRRMLAETKVKAGDLRAVLGI